MNILLVGLGGMGLVHICNINHLKDHRVVAAVGVSESDKKRAEDYGIPFFASIDDAFASGIKIDVVDITTPTFMHKKNVLNALDYGVDVICEKPIALSKADAEEMYAKAHDKGVSLIIAQVLRFTKEYKALKALIDSKRYGDVLEARFTRLSAEPKWAKDGWLFDKSKSGLIPFDLHIHDLDMIVSLFGKPKSTRAIQSSVKGESFPCYYHFDYGYDNFNVHAEAGWLKASIPFTATWYVIFEHGVAINDGEKIVVYPEDSDKIDVDTHYDIVVSTGINVPPTGWYYEELKSILSSLDNKTESSVKEEEVISVLDILEKL